MTLSKLSLRNAKRQARDYLVYFVTIVIAASLIYAFNGLVFSQELLKLSTLMSNLPAFVVLASIVVVCIIGWLVHYTTNFMLSRRSRELGTYLLIGLENQQVAWLFVLENLTVGGVALILGIVLGNLIFQALRAILLHLFGSSYTFSFAFSLRAIGLTLFYFICIYLFAQLKSRKRIRSMKIYDLIYFDRQNEDVVIQKSRLRKKVFTFSILSGVIGTVLLLMGNLLFGLLGAVCIIFFLYGFFISFSSGVPAWFDKRPKQKYQNQTLLVFRTLSAKLATMGIVMATIALLFTAVLIAQGAGLTFSALFQNRAKQTTCFDLFISDSDLETNFDEYLNYIQNEIPVTDFWQYSIYQGETLQITNYLEENTTYYSYYPYDTLMKFSDYAALRHMLGYPEVPLEPGHYLIHCMPYLKEQMNRYTQPISVAGSTLTKGNVYTELFSQYLGNGNGEGFLLVVPDESVQTRPISHSIYAALTAEAVSERQYEPLFNIQINRTENEFYTLQVKSQVENEAASMMAVIVFPLYYLALVLTMTAATILTIQQLSETEHYRQQFYLLQKLGMDRREMHRALQQQFAIYYAMPAVPSLLIGVPFIIHLGDAVEPGIMVGSSHPVIITCITLSLFFLIYFIYIWMAYSSLKRNVLPY